MAVIKTDGSGTPKVIATVGTADLTSIESAISDLQDQETALWQAINSIQVLGGKIGAYATFGDLPENSSELSVAVSANDWATVSDENAIYAIVSIDGSGVINWGEPVVTFETDISGKMDIVESATNGNIVAMDADGNAKDSGISADNITTDVLSQSQPTDQRANDTWLEILT